MLKWMCQRLDGQAGARKTVIGYLPEKKDLDLAGLDIPAEHLSELLDVDTETWKNEIPKIEKFLSQFNGNLPPRLLAQFKELKTRLGHTGLESLMVDLEAGPEAQEDCETRVD